MDSTVMTNNYANSTGLAYGAHYVTLASDKVTYDANVGKFILTYITPNLESEASYDQTRAKNSTSNVINSKGNNIGVSSITSSNYVELTVPKYLFYIKEIKTTTLTTTGTNTSTKTSVSHPEGSSPRASSSSTSVSTSVSVSTNEIIRQEYLKGQRFLVVSRDKNYSSPIIIGVLDDGDQQQYSDSSNY